MNKYNTQDYSFSSNITSNVNCSVNTESRKRKEKAYKVIVVGDTGTYN